MATHASILAWRIPTDRGAWWAMVHGNPVGEGTTRRGTATPVHRPQRPAGSTHSSTRGLRPPEQLPNNMAPAASQDLLSLPGCHRFLHKLSKRVLPLGLCTGCSFCLELCQPFSRSSSSSLRSLGSYPDLPSESRPVFLMMYSAYKLNKQGNNIQP